MKMQGVAAARAARTVLLAAALAVPAAAGAVDFNDEKLSLTVFGGMSMGRATGLAVYETAGPTLIDTEAELFLMALGRPTDRITLSGQFGLKRRFDETELEFDWAFGEYRAANWLKLRAGRSKLPLGLYREIQHVGTLRPFLFLPQGLYGHTEFGAESYNGVGFTGILSGQSDWSLEYDLYGGVIGLEEESPEESFEGEGGETDFFRIVGTRFTVSTPVEGLRVMLSGYIGRALPELEDILGEEDDEAEEEEEEGDEETGDGEEGEEEDEEEEEDDSLEGDDTKPNWAAGVSVDYTLDRFLARAEVFFGQDEQGSRSRTMYAELGYFVLPERLQLITRAEFFYAPTEDPTVSFFGKHRELGAGVNWWFSPDFVVKASYHNVYGNRFAYRRDLLDSVLNGSLDRRTHVGLIGAQFSF